MIFDTVIPLLEIYTKEIVLEIKKGYIYIYIYMP